jgi:pyrrolysine biosynthesis protein PylD
MAEGLKAYDLSLRESTGLNLLAVACRAADTSPGEAMRRLAAVTVAVVPVTAGQGVIDGFAESVSSILEHLGAQAFVTVATDVSGIAQAVEEGARLLFMADDHRFVALDLRNGGLVDSTEATARGFVAALEAMSGGLEDKSVLVIGVGRVGEAAVRALLDLGARPRVHDIDVARAMEVAGRHAVPVEEDLEHALGRHTRVIDASWASGIICSHHVTPEMVLAAPGIPLGVSPEAIPLLGKRLVHDALEIGVATMLVMSLG